MRGEKLEYPLDNPEQDVSNTETDTGNSPERQKAMAQDSLWEATQREAQSAFADIGNSYQQILITGHLYPPTDRAQLNREIAEESWKQPEPEPEQLELFYKNHFHGHDPEPDLEPQM